MDDAVGNAISKYVMGEGQTISLPPNHVMRDGLISALLQDRGVLRLITAPHGFGKTELAREYAVRLFSGSHVIWIDGDNPELLLSLDNPLQEDIFQIRRKPSLVIVDNLPWLHEQRAQALSHRIDSALYVGIEVIVTALPSCDFLSSLQPDSLVVRAGDLLIDNQECAPRDEVAANEDTRAFGLKRWHDSAKLLFGRTPPVMWDSEQKGQETCLAGLFSERIPPSLMRGMVCMLLLGHGTFADLERIDVALKNDDVSMLVLDYPIFGIDPVAHTFEVSQFQLAHLKGALLGNRLEQHLLQGSLPLHERVLGLLFDRGEAQRSLQIVDAFCTDESCGRWLVERGWDLLDSGEIETVSMLFSRCPAKMYAEILDLRAMHAWLAGLSGDRKEACYLAKHAFRAAQNDEECRRARVAARLAMFMFDDDAILMQDSPRLASSDYPIDALDFLAGVIESCSNVEVARAFRPEGMPDDERYEQERKMPGKRRERSLIVMFTEYGSRFMGSRAFRLALHILFLVDGEKTKKLAQELGCDLIVESRRRGIMDFSTAVLVRDMWLSGHFGLSGPILDRHDAGVLDGAARMLEMLAHCHGNKKPYLPWEAKASPVTDLELHERASEPLFDEEIAYVRLFGGFEVTVGKRIIGEKGWFRRARTLFSLLVLHQGRDMPREDLINQIWPNSTRVHGRDNFYNAWACCLTILGKKIYMERNGDFCRIDPRYVRSDVAEFEQLARRLLSAHRDANYLLDTYAKMEALYRGGLLPSEQSVKMIVAQRERYRSMYVDAMVAASECALSLNDVRVALWFARKAMEEAQDREDVYRSLMKAQIAAGQRCPAIKTYLGCQHYLRNTLGLDPSLETRELYNTLVTTDPELLRLDMSSFE